MIKDYYPLWPSKKGAKVTAIKKACRQLGLKYHHNVN